MAKSQNTKNKRRKPVKQHASKKQKETAYDRVSREIDELMWDVATVADKLLDLLPTFKRLSLKNRQLIYDHMDVVMSGLEASLDDYHATLPEYDDDENCVTCDLLDAAMALGVAGIFSKILMKVAEDRNIKVEWPDSIDLPHPETEPPLSKQLKAKED